MANKFLIFLLFLALPSLAQTSDPKAPGTPVVGTAVRTVVYEGDTIPYVVLNPVKCYTERTFKNRRQQAAWDRTKYNVKKVYPYAILAAAKLKEYDRILAQMSESDRAKYTKLVEKQLKDEFTEQLKQLTESQGRILIKLIDRETGKTTYTVVKEMRGSFSAFMYQGVALMFGSNLKAEYDPQGNDKAIEEAIRLVENGDF
ncbi:MAG: hypothetical protein K0Q95_1096 [Bacteroidota bacterium]|jgi:hypothetical protein|nr:hypothetical protein [Bacteroidota bacterium]